MEIMHERQQYSSLTVQMVSLSAATPGFGTLNFSQMELSWTGGDFLNLVESPRTRAHGVDELTDFSS